MNRIIITLLFLISTLSILAQGKQKMEPAVFDIWKTITSKQISNNGQWVVYRAGNEAKDAKLYIYNTSTGSTVTFDRGHNAQISNNNQWLAFQVSAPRDTIQALKRKKIDKDQLPKDSLFIYNLASRSVISIENVASFQLPKKWDDWLIYKKAFVKEDNEVVSDQEVTKKDGTLLVFYDLRDRSIYSFPGVHDYTIAKEQAGAIFSNSGRFGGYDAGIYQFDFKGKQAHHLFGQRGKFYALNLDQQGQQACFIADTDTTEQEVRPLTLYHWNKQNNKTNIVTKGNPINKKNHFSVSKHFKPYFSENGKTLYYGVAPYPILQDSNLLKEDIVNVEVWHYQDARIYPQQNKELEDDKKKTYLRAWDINTQKTTNITSPSISWFSLADKGNAPHILISEEEKYLQSANWEGYPVKKDLSIINQHTGETKKIATALRARPKFSPAGQYVYWFNVVDTAWFAYHIASSKTIQLTDNSTVPFYDELNDRPMLPYSNGILGWSDADEFFYVYDRFDIWKINPLSPNTKQRLTNGRPNKTTYRNIVLDKEANSINASGKLLVHFFNHQDKSSGYAQLDLKTLTIKVLTSGDFKYSNEVIKARDSVQLIFQKENFETFPDLIYTNLAFQEEKQISEINPQQKDYAWGSIELVEWKDNEGTKHQGMLVKPPHFDPNKKYPMLVNFYERSSHKLHQHRAPYPHRSTINYSYYANRGYVIFNPDIIYTIGYPGESAYKIVTSGVQHLISQGFVDKNNIGLQGHSWGGYQVAYITTKTDLFKCAESGAPVVNMFSAYGGIRWGSGISRMFQYENTQSRIGGTIWEYPNRYKENSPLFELDKVNTPILILHNDKDGAVPWYQGIEYFMGLRRLNKPAWLLNYNGEPHWPLKRPNRLDFNRRMSQFFDHYLQGAPMPSWMKNGVPAIEKGILQGFE